MLDQAFAVLGEDAGHPDSIVHGPDGAPRVICRYKIIQMTHGEKTLGEGAGSAHFVSLKLFRH